MWRSMPRAAIRPRQRATPPRLSSAYRGLLTPHTRLGWGPWRERRATGPAVSLRSRCRDRRLTRSRKRQRHRGGDHAKAGAHDWAKAAAFGDRAEKRLWPRLPTGRRGGRRPEAHYRAASTAPTVINHGWEGMPFATTSSELSPRSIVFGTSNRAETISAPVATPIELKLWEVA
jgi:hypothetical protein